MPWRTDMDFEKFTERARGFVQSAQSLALREGHQRFTPEHLLKVLLDDEEGLAAGLIRTAGGDPKAALRETETQLKKLPRVEGSGAGQGYQAPAIEKSEASRILKAAGVTPQGLENAINALRKGRTADTASAEQGYDALKRYARDLTEAARSGKLDPVIGRDEEIRRTIQ